MASRGALLWLSATPSFPRGPAQGGLCQSQTRPHHSQTQRPQWPCTLWLHPELPAWLLRPHLSVHYLLPQQTLIMKVSAFSALQPHQASQSSPIRQPFPPSSQWLCHSSAVTVWLVIVLSQCSAQMSPPLLNKCPHFINLLLFPSEPYHYLKLSRLFTISLQKKSNTAQDVVKPSTEQVLHAWSHFADDEIEAERYQVTYQHHVEIKPRPGLEPMHVQPSPDSMSCFVVWKWCPLP